MRREVSVSTTVLPIDVPIAPKSTPEPWNSVSSPQHGDHIYIRAR